MLSVVEIFNSIQGEGRYHSYPATFIRFFGCNRRCSFCDTKYAYASDKGVKTYTVEQLLTVLEEYGPKQIIVLTGGEPLKQGDVLFTFIQEVKDKFLDRIVSLETNGDYFVDGKDLSAQFYLLLRLIDYVAISPKDIKVAQILRRWYDNALSCGKDKVDIKVVTDCNLVGTELIEYATMLMPLTTGVETVDREIKQRVWSYCVEHSILYSPRLHVDVWGYNKRGI